MLTGLILNLQKLQRYPVIKAIMKSRITYKYNFILYYINKYFLH